MEKVIFVRWLVGTSAFIHFKIMFHFIISEKLLSKISTSIFQEIISNRAILVMHWHTVTTFFSIGLNVCFYNSFTIIFLLHFPWKPHTSGKIFQALSL